MNHFPSYLCTMNCWFGILWLFKSYSLRWTPSPPSLHMTWASLARGWSWPGHYVVTSLGWPRELLTSPLDCRGATTRCQWVAMWQYWQYWQSMARPDQVMRGSPGSGTSTGHGQPRPLASVLSTQWPGPGLNTSLSPGPGSLKYVTRGAGCCHSRHYPAPVSRSPHVTLPIMLVPLILFSVFLMLSYVALAGLLPLTLLEAESLSGCIIETSYLETEFQERKLFFGSLKS